MKVRRPLVLASLVQDYPFDAGSEYPKRPSRQTCGQRWNTE
jgi:hypothetical protein